MHSGRTGKTPQTGVSSYPSTSTTFIPLLIYRFHLMLDLRREDLGGSLALESLRTVDQTTLGVGTAVDEIGVVEGELDGAVDDRVDGLGTQHEAVVLVADLVAPAAEAATRPDVLGLELGEELLEYSLARAKEWGNRGRSGGGRC